MLKRSKIQVVHSRNKTNSNSRTGNIMVKLISATRKSIKFSERTMQVKIINIGIIRAEREVIAVHIMVDVFTSIKKILILMTKKMKTTMKQKHSKLILMIFQ